MEQGLGQGTSERMVRGDRSVGGAADIPAGLGLDPGVRDLLVLPPGGPLGPTGRVPAHGGRHCPGELHREQALGDGRRALRRRRGPGRGALAACQEPDVQALQGGLPWPGGHGCPGGFGRLLARGPPAGRGLPGRRDLPEVCGGDRDLAAPALAVPGQRRHRRPGRQGVGFPQGQGRRRRREERAAVGPRPGPPAAVGPAPAAGAAGQGRPPLREARGAAGRHLRGRRERGHIFRLQAPAEGWPGPSPGWRC